MATVLTPIEAFLNRFYSVWCHTFLYINCNNFLLTIAMVIVPFGQFSSQLCQLYLATAIYSYSMAIAMYNMRNLISNKAKYTIFFWPFKRLNTSSQCPKNKRHLEHTLSSKDINSIFLRRAFIFFIPLFTKQNTLFFFTI